MQLKQLIAELETFLKHAPADFCASAHMSGVFVGAERRPVPLSTSLTYEDLVEALTHLKDQESVLLAMDAVKVNNHFLHAEVVALKRHLEKEQQRPTYAREGRRWEAALASVTGLMAMPTSSGNYDTEVCAKSAVKLADALILEFDKKES